MAYRADPGDYDFIQRYHPHREGPLPEPEKPYRARIPKGANPQWHNQYLLSEGTWDPSKQNRMEDSLNFDIFKTTMQAYVDMTRRIDPYTLERLTRDVEDAYRIYGDVPSTRERKVYYEDMAQNFQEGQVPTTIGEAEKFIIGAHMPGFLKMAQSVEGATTPSRNPQDTMWAVQSYVEGMMKSWRDPHQYRKMEPFGGITASYAAFRKEQRQMANMPNTLGTSFIESHEYGEYSQGLDAEAVGTENAPIVGNNPYIDPYTGEVIPPGPPPFEAKALDLTPYNVIQRPPEEPGMYVGGTDADLVGRNMALYDLERTRQSLNTERVVGNQIDLVDIEGKPFKAEAATGPVTFYGKSPNLPGRAASEMVDPRSRVIAQSLAQSIKIGGVFGAYQAEVAGQLAAGGFQAIGEKPWETFEQAHLQKLSAYERAMKFFYFGSEGGEKQYSGVYGYLPSKAVTPTGGRVPTSVNRARRTGTEYEADLFAAVVNREAVPPNPKALSGATAAAMRERGLLDLNPEVLAAQEVVRQYEKRSMGYRRMAYDLLEQERPELFAEVPPNMEKQAADLLESEAIKYAHERRVTIRPRRGPAGSAGYMSMPVRRLWRAENYDPTMQARATIPYPGLMARGGGSGARSLRRLNARRERASRGSTSIEPRVGQLRYQPSGFDPNLPHLGVTTGNEIPIEDLPEDAQEHVRAFRESQINIPYNADVGQVHQALTQIRRTLAHGQDVVIPTHGEQVLRGQEQTGQRMYALGNPEAQSALSQGLEAIRTGTIAPLSQTPRDEIETPGEMDYPPMRRKAYTAPGVTRTVPYFPSGGGQQPPEEPPPTDFQPMDEEEPPPGAHIGAATLRFAPRPEVTSIANTLRAGASAIAALPPGWGKTEIMQGGLAARGFNAQGEALPNQRLLSTIVSPYRSLSIDLARRLNMIGKPEGYQLAPGETGDVIKAHFLPGHPGVGADPKLLQEYKQAHNLYWRDVKASVEELPGGGYKWRQGAPPVVGIMSPEKFVAQRETRFGARQANIMASVGGVTIMEEAQETMGAGNRWMMKYIASTSQQMFPSMPILGVGGTMTPEMIQSLSERIGAENVVHEPVDLSHIQFKAEAVRRGNYVETGARYAQEMEGGRLIYGYRTADVEAMRDRIVAQGGTAYQFHKGEGLTGPIPQEELDRVQNMFYEGIPSETTVSASSAAGLGLDIRGLKSTAQIGPASPSDLIQRATRLRASRGGGEFRLAAEPYQYQEFANYSRQNLGSLTPMQMALSYAHARGGEYSANWKTAADQIRANIGQALKAQGQSQYIASDVVDMLGEQGMIGMVPLPGGEGVTMGFLNQGSVPEIAQQLEGATYAHPVESNRQVPFGEYKGILAETRAREYEAMGKILGQTRGLSPGAAGEQVKQGLTAYSKGGLPGLESFADRLLPQNIADNFVESVVQLTRDFHASSEQQQNSQRAVRQFTQAVNEQEQMLGGNTAARVAASQGLAGAASVAGGNVGATLGQMAVNMGGGYSATGGPPIGFPPVGGGPPGGGNIRRPWGGPYGQALYTSYIARRFYQMIMAPQFQSAEQYAAMEQELAPLAYYGNAGALNLTGTAGGFPAEQGQAQSRMGRAAWQFLSPVMQLGNNISNISPYLNRQIVAGTAAAGSVAIGSILSSGFLGMQALPLAGPIGGIIAGGIGAYYLGSETANALQGWTPPEGYQIHPQGVQPAWTQPSTGTGNGSVQTRPRGILPASQQDILQGKAPTDMTQLAEMLSKESGNVLSPDKIAPIISSIQMQSGEVLRPNTPQWQAAIDMIRQSATLGTTPQKLVGAGTQYAGAGQYAIGTPQYFQEATQFALATPQQQQIMSEQRQFTASIAGQLYPYVGNQREAFALTQQYGLENQAQVGAATSLMSLFQTYGGNLGQMVGAEHTGVDQWQVLRNRDLLLRSQQQFGPAMTRQLMPFAQGLLGAGMNVNQLPRAFSQLGAMFQGYTPDQMNLATQVFGGDWRATSYASYFQPQILQDMGMNLNAARMYDVSGNPIAETSGAQFLSAGIAWNQQGLAAAAPFTGIQNTIGGAQQFLGIQNRDMAASFLVGGTRGMQDYANNRLYQLSQAGAGVNMARIAEQQNYLWGGGAWTGAPAPGSLWALQDQQRQLQYRSQMQDFAFNLQRSQTTNEFAVQRENLQFERMGVTQEFGQWQRGFNQAGALLQRDWTRQDWQYSDQMRNLQFGWNLQDINEAIRFSTGRQRQQLVRQRERMGTVQSLEGEHIDDQRKRQEELWSREDERFTKQNQYAEQLDDLDRRSFSLNKTQRETLYEMDREDLKRRIDDYQRQRKIEEQINKLQRDHQVKMLELEKQSAGIQAEAAKVQHDLYEAQKKANRAWSDMEGELSNISKYGGSSAVINFMKSFVAMMGEMGNVPASTIDAWVRLFDKVSGGPGGKYGYE